jgi:hypothetical protein
VCHGYTRHSEHNGPISPWHQREKSNGACWSGVESSVFSFFERLRQTRLCRWMGCVCSFYLVVIYIFDLDLFGPVCEFTRDLSIFVQLAVLKSSLSWIEKCSWSYSITRRAFVHYECCLMMAREMWQSHMVSWNMDSHRLQHKHWTSLRHH